jgi:hypothetical protein
MGARFGRIAQGVVARQFVPRCNRVSERAGNDSHPVCAIAAGARPPTCHEAGLTSPPRSTRVSAAAPSAAAQGRAHASIGATAWNSKRLAIQSHPTAWPSRFAVPCRSSGPPESAYKRQDDRTCRQQAPARQLRLWRGTPQHSAVTADQAGTVNQTVVLRYHESDEKLRRLAPSGLSRIFMSCSGVTRPQDGQGHVNGRALLTQLG